MFLNECIENSIDIDYPAFEDDALAIEVLNLMHKGNLESLPVLHEGKISAIVTLQDLLSVKDEGNIESLPLKEMYLTKTESIGLHEHLFDAYSRIRSFSGAIVPVSEKDGSYLGCIEKRIFYEKIAEVFHLGEDGMTLELEVPSVGLKLSEIVAILEKNDATVLSLGTYHAPGMIVTFRVQTHDFYRLIKNLEKYGYSIRYSSKSIQEKDEDLREKALEFIRLMDM
ncbi:MAG: CBS domain-containing protein [Chlorobiaceae bacterium]|nr:CBS domain-containing protein [Chlorobiaceae bacterium]